MNEFLSEKFNIPDLPKNFDPTDPKLWKTNFFCFDKLSEPFDSIEKYGFSEEELLALLWIRQLRHRVKVTGLSLFLTIEGAHRSGKSRFAVTLGCLFSKDFLADMGRYIVSNSDQLLDLIEYIEKNHIIDPVILVDEAGASLNSGDWFESMQKAVIKTFTIIGWLHPTIIFVAPIKDMILAGVRKMSHWLIKVNRKSNDYTTIIPYEITYNSMKGVPYYKKPKIKLFGIPRKINSIRITLPPKEIDDQYNEIEKARKPIMISDIRSDAGGGKVKVTKPMPDFKIIADLATFVAVTPELFSTGQKRDGEWKIDHDIIESKFSDQYQMNSKIAKKVKTLAKSRLIDYAIGKKEIEQQKKDI